MVSKNKFKQAALSGVCIFSLLANSAAAFTADDYFAAASNGRLDQLHNFVQESNRLIMLNGGDYRLNLDIVNANGNTAAMEAAANGQIEVLDYLVKNGANLEVRNAYGETAYSLAVKNNQTNAANYILSYFENKMQLMQQTSVAPAKPVATTTASSSGIGGGWLMAIGAVAGVGGALAAAAGGGGGSSGGGGGTAFSYTPDATQDGITDTGGGSGVGDSHPNADDEDDFLTAESTEQEGYFAMNTHFAAARGYAGSLYVRDDSSGFLENDTADDNIIVAVLDTGVDLDHPDLNDNLLLSLDVTCRTTTGCVAGADDTDGHGTLVTGIIAAEKGDGTTGMHGIAPESRIIPIRAIGVSNGSDILGIQYAVDNNANVINASYSLTDGSSNEYPIVTATGQGVAPFTVSGLVDLLEEEEGGVSYYEAFQNMVVNDKIIVYAAGNDGMSEVSLLAGLPYYFQGADPGGITGYTTVNPNLYNWKTNWVAVVSLDDSNVISSFSNECGVAKDWCLAAPGELAISTSNDGLYETDGIQGTSYAAPNVSGAIAIMLGAFPHLTPQDALEILFDTATDLGTAGVDAVYGHGIINLDDATDPTAGGWNILTGPASFTSSVALADTRIALSAPFGDGLNSLSSKKLIFVDGYKKDYTINASALVKSNVVEEDKTVVLQKFGESALPEQTKLGGLNLGLTTVSKFAEGSAESKMFGANEATIGKMLVSTDLPVLGHVVKAMYSENTNLSDVSAANSATSFANNSISGAFKNQYLGFSDEAKSVSLGIGSEKLGATLGYYFSNADTSFEDSNNLDVRGFYSSVNYKPAANHSLNLQSGMNVEKGSFMGAESSGALSLSDETKTYFTKFSYEHNLTSNLTFLGNYGFGVSQLGVAQNSLIKNVSDAYSDSFALGLEYKNITNDDKLGISFSQPLRVRSANANISLPVDILSGGAVVYDNFNASIAPEGRELDLEGYYSSKLSDESNFMLGTMLRSEPNNIKNAPLEALFLTKYNLSF